MSYALYTAHNHNRMYGAVLEFQSDSILECYNEAQAITLARFPSIKHVWIEDARLEVIWCRENDMLTPELVYKKMQQLRDTMPAVTTWRDNEHFTYMQYSAHNSMFRFFKDDTPLYTWQHALVSNNVSVYINFSQMRRQVLHAINGDLQFATCAIYMLDLLQEKHSVG